MVKKSVNKAIGEGFDRDKNKVGVDVG